MLVRVRNPEHSRQAVWFFEQPEYFEYQGEEVQLRHVLAHELALTTGDPEFPVRVIQRSRIISIDGQDYEQPTAQNQNQVKIVKGSKGQEYAVTNTNGQWHCTCPGFQFRRACKHTQG